MTNIKNNLNNNIEKANLLTDSTFTYISHIEPSVLHLDTFRRYFFISAFWHSTKLKKNYYKCYVGLLSMCSLHSVLLQ